MNENKYNLEEYFPQNDWKNIFKEIDATTNFTTKINALLHEEEKKYYLLPEKEEVFNAFKFTSFKDTKVVILGQDPYHKKGQANGLSFAVKKKQPLPPSLKNIIKALSYDLNISTSTANGNLLKGWAESGVLLLNTILTVREGAPLSHQKIGWINFTDILIHYLSEKKQNLIFMLWGNYSKSKASLISKEKHLILTSTHPSPFSAHKGFLTCKHFSTANNYLKKNNKPLISWI